ncbi:MAG: HyaD/HybD family hydrogenase maturation endopeptidase [Campylobacterales bacterium]|nr:HyaD/HybD family hydrogenase maturation endopeptidase [Campylobacterales bacterium]
MGTAVVGVGTIIYKDEGIGVYAQRYIEKNYTFKSDVTLVDGGVLGFQLMTYYQDYDHVIILDTITMDDEAGAIYNIPAEELLGLGSYKQTAHEVEIVEMLEICSMLEKMAEVGIIGIVPEDIKSVKIDLTDLMKEKFQDFINTAMNELKKRGIEFEKNETEVPLEEIINHYQDPGQGELNHGN